MLDELERDERLRFTLDGQLATVDDYLEIRPEAEERIRRLVQSGRLAIGPWQTLVDEFLVYMAPKLLGVGRELALFGPLADLGAAPALRWTSVERIGDDLRLMARPIAPGG